MKPEELLSDLAARLEVLRSKLEKNIVRRSLAKEEKCRKMAGKGAKLEETARNRARDAEELVRTRFVGKAAECADKEWETLEREFVDGRWRPGMAKSAEARIDLERAAKDLDEGTEGLDKIQLGPDTERYMEEKMKEVGARLDEMAASLSDEVGRARELRESAARLKHRVAHLARRLEQE